MKKITVIVNIIIFILLISSTLLAEEYKSVFRNPEGNVSIEANKLDYYKDKYVADGNVELSYDYYNLFAEYLEYEDNTKLNANNVRATTCSNHDKPHFCIMASEIKVSDYNDVSYKVHFKDVRLKLKDTTIIRLPYFNYQANKVQEAAYIALPTPWYNKKDGFYLYYTPRLFRSDKGYLDVYAKYSIKNHLVYSVYYNYGFDGIITDTPYKTMKFTDMIKSVTQMSKSYPEDGEYGKVFDRMAKVQGKIGTTYKLSARTIDKEDVDIYKLPEISLDWHMKPLGNIERYDQRVLMNPVASVVWAREKDTPMLDKYVTKYAFELEVPYCLGSFDGIYVQPMVKLAYNKYNEYSDYKACATGVDFTKYYKDNSFWNFRYVLSSESGETPFEFDSIKYEQGIMVAGQKNLGKYSVGAWAAYSPNDEEFYKYGVMLGYKLDCMWAGAGYDFYEREFMFNFALLGF